MKQVFLKVKTIFKLRMTPNFKVFPRTAHKSLGRTTLDNGSADVRFFKLCVLYPWKVYMMKKENYCKVAD